MRSAFTGDKFPVTPEKETVPSLTVTGVKLDIINAVFAYGQALERAGYLAHKAPGSDELHEAMDDGTKKFKAMYDAINQLDFL